MAEPNVTQLGFAQLLSAIRQSENNIRTEIELLRTEMTAMETRLRAEISSQVGSLRQDFANHKVEIQRRVAQSESKTLDDVDRAEKALRSEFLAHDPE